MKYVENNLCVNEHVVAKAKVSWTVIAVVIIRAAIWALIGFLIWKGSQNGQLIDVSDLVSHLPESVSQVILPYLQNSSDGDTLISNGTLSQPVIAGTGVSLNINMKYVFFVWCGLIFCQVVYKILSISAIELAVTEKKIVGKTGIIRSHSVDAFLEKIDYFRINESLWGRIFNYSEIEIGTTSSKIKFPYIEYAVEFRNTVMDCAETRKYKGLIAQTRLVYNGGTEGNYPQKRQL